MTEPNSAPGLPRLHTVEEVARALRCTERYVAERARLREWPHRRGARGRVTFTDDDITAVLELMAKPAAPEAPVGRLAFAPRSAGRRRQRQL